MIQTERKKNKETTDQEVPILYVLKAIANRLRRIDEDLSFARIYSNEMIGLIEESLTRQLEMERKMRDERRTRMDTTPISVLIELVERRLDEARGSDGIDRLFALMEVKGILDSVNGLMDSKEVSEKLTVLRRRGYTDTHR